MRVYIDNAVEAAFDFDHEAVANDVCREVLEKENCPFDCEINITITDDDEIRQINKRTRDIDKATDVLSFPGMFFESPAVFDVGDMEMSDLIDPESGLIVLGDIVLSFDRIKKQALEYGHSIKREYAFLITHSMLHLCGYDHMTESEAAVMEERQRLILDGLKITRGDNNEQ
ncbi:MAG: rRNA maturation RNase YbeY [Lachnospiraceae bacterium]|nr:rRNA maturation RNase YbeY [Lachnospiraceae bacterium]